MELTTKKIRFFSKAYADGKSLYLSAFPENERLSYPFLIGTSYRRMADFYAYYDGEDFIGLVYLLHNTDVVYLFYFAISPNSQSKGYGTSILESVKAFAGERPVILAMESLDETAANYTQRLRRLAFYQRNGFILAPYRYHELEETYQVMTTDLAVRIEAVEQLTRQALFNLLPLSFEKQEQLADES